MFVSAVAYLAMRTFVTKSFTLHNYRFLENPIAYTSGLTRLLTTAHLHAFYAHFLVWPHPMCAGEWWRSGGGCPVLQAVT